MPPAVTVRGLRELNAALAKADRQTRLGVRGELLQVAQPVQQGAEQLAAANITRIGPRWSKMRIGITRSLVYVAPRQRGTRVRTSKSRPNFGTLLMDRAMQPALDAHTAEIEAGFERMLDTVADDFNH